MANNPAIKKYIENSELPGYRANEYLVVLLPHEDLRNRINNIKNELAQKYNTPKPKSTKPHLALASFSVWEMMEDKLLQKLHVIAMGFPPFKVELKDYSSFPTHTLFINVQSKLPIMNLVKNLKEARRLMRCPGKEPFFVETPYIPISRKLSDEQYEIAWKEYSHRHFTASFVADGMLLLKRRAGDRNYQIVQRFEFLNMPVNIKQAELF
jgi:2'-5' RNA ligase